MKNSSVSLVVAALTVLSPLGIAAAAETPASAGAPKTSAADTTPITPATPAKPTDAKSKAELEGKMPEVEVNKSKVTILDHELHEQDRLIAIEKKNTKASELDSALNSPGATPSILGGYSSKVRSGIAQERVELMARSRNKEEKDALKKQIDDLRAMRRELDGARESKSRANR